MVFTRYDCADLKPSTLACSKLIESRIAGHTVVLNYWGTFVTDCKNRGQIGDAQLTVHVVRNSEVSNTLHMGRDRCPSTLHTYIYPYYTAHTRERT